MRTAIVIGAGASGLAAAWELKRGGADVLVIDSAEQPGGVICGQERDGFCVDEGPSEMQLKSTRMESLLGEMGLGAKMQEANPNASRRYVVRAGRPVALPATPLGGILNPCLSLKGKFDLLREFTHPKSNLDDETVSDFVRRRIGNDFLDYLVGPLVSGVYAGDPDTLSMRHAFPTLWDLEASSGGLIRGALRLKRENKEKGEAPYKKRLVSFEGGMHKMPQMLAAQLGDAVATGARVNNIGTSNGGWIIRWRRGRSEQLERTAKLVLAVPAHALASLPLPGELHDMLAPLAALPYSPVATAFVGYTREQVRHPLDGFGVLIPRRETQGVIGVLFLSSLFPNRAPKGHVAMLAFVGGMYAPRYAAMNDYEILALVKGELSRLLGVKGVPVIEHVRHWPRAIPHFPVGYQTSLNALDAAEKRWPTLAIVGNYRGTPGTGDCIVRACDSAKALLTR
jgi:oxygen-dependent protoporphyrinogen oxidase